MFAIKEIIHMSSVYTSHVPISEFLFEIGGTQLHNRTFLFSQLHIPAVQVDHTGRLVPCHKPRQKKIAVWA